MQHLKGLTPHIGTSTVHPHMGKRGWPFADPSGKETDDTDGKLEMEAATEDKVLGSRHMRDVYFKAMPGGLGVREWRVRPDTDLVNITQTTRTASLVG